MTNFLPATESIMRGIAGHCNSGAGWAALQTCPSSVLAEYGIVLPEGTRGPANRGAVAVSTPLLEDCFAFPAWTSKRVRTDVPFELQLFLCGAKQSALILGRTADLREFGALVLESGGHAMLTPYRWVPQGDSSKGGYSNMMQRAGADDDRDSVRRGLLVACDAGQLALGWVASWLSWDSAMGHFLGYPACCIRSFSERWPEALRQHDGDIVPMLISGAGRRSMPWENNILARYFNKCLLQHFPCSFECAESVRMSRTVYAKLKGMDPELAHEIRKVMQSPVLYTDSAGVFIFPDGEIAISDEEWMLRYSPAKVMCTASNSALRDYILTADAIIGEVGATLRISADENAHLLRFDANVPYRNEES